jgi:hypothetical protein
MVGKSQSGNCNPAMCALRGRAGQDQCRYLQDKMHLLLAGRLKGVASIRWRTSSIQRTGYNSARRNQGAQGKSPMMRTENRQLFFRGTLCGCEEEQETGDVWLCRQARRPGRGDVVEQRPPSFVGVSTWGRRARSSKSLFLAPFQRLSGCLALKM